MGESWLKRHQRDCALFQGSSTGWQGLGAEMHRITEYPELERTHEDHPSPTPAQDSPGNGLDLALPIGAANTVPDPRWCRRAESGQIWSMPGSLCTPAVLPHVLSSFPTPTSTSNSPRLTPLTLLLVLNKISMTVSDPHSRVSGDVCA